MRQDGRTMSADEFDGWMQARKIRVATGKPTTMTSQQALPVPALATGPLAMHADSPGVGLLAASQIINPVTLQVASFSDVQNARHALSLLQGAAIAQAQLQDADIGGKKIWRLRIGPVAEAATAELAARIVGLGFGQPQRVRN
jgi:rare lipoprotein A